MSYKDYDWAKLYQEKKDTNLDVFLLEFMPNENLFKEKKTFAITDAELAKIVHGKQHT